MEYLSGRFPGDIFTSVNDPYQIHKRVVEVKEDSISFNIVGQEISGPKTAPIEHYVHVIDTVYTRKNQKIIHRLFGDDQTECLSPVEIKERLEPGEPITLKRCGLIEALHHFDAYSLSTKGYILWDLNF